MSESKKSVSQYFDHKDKVNPRGLEFTEQLFTALEAPLKAQGGTKHDNGKPDFTFVSYELMEALARVREFGARKYSRNNWKKGFKINRSGAAALRHIMAFLSGQDNDEESGLSHLSHAVACLEHAIYDMKHHPENDDRQE